ncbi:hypothetical protein GAYE_SCF05G2644 [Galdieria yellowstonensis]|jgi:hypothetical protein|uniref:Uncharacterized protein n=1 Tax=Galdieria yellowstonensis TaxID=3028027 RepID=A0AAV9IC07_9RHOD|nr:hypothetical protein GAYE_SCF05G2644 [Galdieria yellowstonensis]
MRVRVKSSVYTSAKKRFQFLAFDKSEPWKYGYNKLRYLQGEIKNKKWLSPGHITSRNDKKWHKVRHESD